MTFNTVRKLGLGLPDVEEGTAHGSPALKVRGKLLACLAVNKSAEPGTLAVRIDLEQRDGLLAEAPDTYYLTDHYRNYPIVLVRLSRIEIGQLKDLLSASWRFVTATKAKPRRTSRRGSTQP
ncbi:MAG TPA: MmcQ/YjbR family DNA-binding protein [Bryobacteraceae bacterium]|nr:MmcQ/YjbR family DNA-binding protein [Bryobacteraceae bacterium]